MADNSSEKPQKPVAKKPTTAKPAVEKEAPPAVAETKPQQKSAVLAILALISGILAVVIALIPFINFLVFIPGLTAIILAIVALATKAPKKGMSITGLILGIGSGIVAVIVWLVFFVLLAGLAASESDITIDSMDDMMQQEIMGDLPIPAGFEDGGQGLAYQFLEGNCSFYDACVKVELFAYTDCLGGVEVLGDEIDFATDTVYAGTYEPGSPMFAGEYQEIEVPIFSPEATGVQLTEIICYSD